MSHILIYQFNEDLVSRNYTYFSSQKEAILFFMNQYEDYLRSSSPELPENILTEITEYVIFLYCFYDFAYLEVDPDSGNYKGFGKDGFMKIFLEFIEENKRISNKEAEKTV